MANMPEYMRIRHYVIDLVINHPDMDLRIMSERELSSAFQVSRTTVRNALKDLVDEGYLLVKPSSGMYLNPQRAINGLGATRNFYKVLILIGDGKFSYIDGFYMRILGDVFRCWENLPVRLQMLYLVGTKERIVPEILDYSADGALWIRPAPGMQPVIDQLRDRLPVQLISGEFPGDGCNAAIDFTAAGRVAAADFLDRGIREVLFVGHGNDGVRARLYEGWSAEFRRRGLDFPAKRRLSVSDRLASRLQLQLQHPEIGGLFTFGTEMKTVNDVFTTLPEAVRARCRIICDDSPFALYQCAIRPDALLPLSPPELSQAAAAALFRRLETGAFPEPRQPAPLPRLETI